MNRNPMFYQSEQAELGIVIRSAPFASLVADAGSGLIAEHLPLYLRETEDGLRLEGHLMARSDMAKAEGREVLALFQGGSGYVSPAWYPSKQLHGKVVPTWNYSVVQARGVLSIKRDPEWLLQHLTALPAQMEYGAAGAWAVSDAPKDFITRQMRGIIGVEITVTALEGVQKMSQNKEAADRAGVAEGFARAGETGLAEQVRAADRS
jgi:transcriptional regulator